MITEIEEFLKENDDFDIFNMIKLAIINKASELGENLGDDFGIKE